MNHSSEPGLEFRRAYSQKTGVMEVVRSQATWSSFPTNDRRSFLKLLVAAPLFATIGHAALLLR